MQGQPYDRKQGIQLSDNHNYDYRLRKHENISPCFATEFNLSMYQLFKDCDVDKLYHLTGYANLENPQIQINGWATSYTGIKDLSTRIVAAMSSSGDFNCRLISDVDIMEPNENNEILYRVIQEYSCWNRE